MLWACESRIAVVDERVRARLLTGSWLMAATVVRPPNSLLTVDNNEVTAIVDRSRPGC
jgi:hypothetical protein